jgi:hypothetical protein
MNGFGFSHRAILGRVKMKSHLSSCRNMTNTMYFVYVPMEKIQHMKVFCFENDFAALKNKKKSFEEKKQTFLKPNQRISQ